MHDSEDSEVGSDERGLKIISRGVTKKGNDGDTSKLQRRELSAYLLGQWA
jgi:hypothetical protein